MFIRILRLVAVTLVTGSDVMSGQAFEATVTVTLDGETRDGCGEPTGADPRR